MGFQVFPAARLERLLASIRGHFGQMEKSHQPAQGEVGIRSVQGVPDGSPFFWAPLHQCVFTTDCVVPQPSFVERHVFLM